MIVSQKNVSIKIQRNSCVYSHSNPTAAQNASALASGGIRLYDYQAAMVAEVERYRLQGIQRILLAVIMGAGKTVIASSMIGDEVAKGQRCVFLVNLNVLLDQTAETLRSLGVSCTVLQGDRHVDAEAPVVVASLQTIAARLRQGKSLDELLGDRPSLIFGDEAHNLSFQKSYLAIERHYIPKGTVFIGMSATPWRLSKKEWLGQRFDALVTGPQPPEIIKRGKAVPCRGFTLTGAIDLDSLHVRNGEYIDTEIATQATRDEALNHVVNEWQRLCSGRPTLMVGATVNQAELTRDRFLKRGIQAELIVGSTPSEDRKAIFKRVEQGETQVICSVGCLTAGFNLPCLSAILYVRATKSRSLFHQTAGRGSRPYAGKADYTLLDFGGNLKRLGNPMGFQDYGIDQPKQNDNAVITKTCPNCQAEVSIFAQVCPECGYEFGEEIEEVEDDTLTLRQLNEFADALTKFKIKKLRASRRAAFKEGRSPDEPINQFASEFGHNPPADWLLNACLGKRYSKKRKQLFVDYLESRKQPGKWAEKWLQYHINLEFGIDSVEPESWADVLLVPETADWERVKAAYVHLEQQYRPDRYGGDDLALQMQRINLALSEAREELQGGVA